MATPVATPDEVRSRLNLPTEAESPAGISNEDIQTYLEDAAFEVDQVSSGGQIGDALRKQLEWRLAGIMIFGTRKDLRSYHQQSQGNASKTFEVKQIDELKQWVRRNDPTGSLLADQRDFWYESYQG